MNNYTNNKQEKYIQVLTTQTRKYVHVCFINTTIKRIFSFQYPNNNKYNNMTKIKKVYLKIKTINFINKLNRALIKLKKETHRIRYASYNEKLMILKMQLTIKIM